MLGLGNDQENKFEALRKQAEGRTGGFDIMRLRFGIVRSAIHNAEISPTIARAQENVRLAQAENEKYEYDREVKRLAEVAQLESTYKAPSAEVPEADVRYAAQANSQMSDQEAMIAEARARTQEAHITKSNNYDQ